MQFSSNLDRFKSYSANLVIWPHNIICFRQFAQRCGLLTKRISSALTSPKAGKTGIKLLSWIKLNSLSLNDFFWQLCWNQLFGLFGRRACLFCRITDLRPHGASRFLIRNTCCKSQSKENWCFQRWRHRHLFLESHVRTQYNFPWQVEQFLLLGNCRNLFILNIKFVTPP